MTLGGADRAKKNWRKRDKEARNIDQVNVRVPIRLKDAFKQFGELLRDDKKSWEVFEAAFLTGYAALGAACD